MNSSRIATHNGFPIERLENRIAPAGFIFAAGRGVVSVFSDPQLDHNYEDLADSFVPFPGYKGPILVASGDFNGDGNDELVTAKAAGISPEVRIWNVSSGGIVSGPIDSILPFTGKERGASVAVGDLDNDGKSELFIGAGPGGAPTVRIYGDTDADGTISDNLLDTFTAFPSTFKGGVKVAAGNTNNVGGVELIAGSWTKSGAVRIFSDSNGNKQLSDSDSTPIEEGTPFGTSYKGGLNLASGQIQSAGGNGAELVVSKPKGKPTVVIFTDSNSSGTVFDDPIFDTLLPGGAGFAKGATVAAGDTDDSGIFVEVITAPAAARGNTIRIFDDSADMGPLLSDDVPLSFEAFTDSFTGGINIAFGKVRAETYTMSGFPQSIPDAGMLQNTIIVPAGAGIIRDVDISLNIAHSFDSDLDVTLVYVPTGTTLALFNDVGGTNEGFIIRLNDEAGTDIGSAINSKPDGAITGTFNPEGTASLSIFDGLVASGEWRLEITDDSGGDTGTLFSWSMHITY
jgi:subtilisin-like proprotein convertase family protein